MSTLTFRNNQTEEEVVIDRSDFIYLKVEILEEDNQIKTGVVFKKDDNFEDEYYFPLHEVNLKRSRAFVPNELDDKETDDFILVNTIDMSLRLAGMEDEEDIKNQTESSYLMNVMTFQNMAKQMAERMSEQMSK